jgi:hypothetical protein
MVGVYAKPVLHALLGYLQDTMSSPQKLCIYSEYAESWTNRLPAIVLRSASDCIEYWSISPAKRLDSTVLVTPEAWSEFGVRQRAEHALYKFEHVVLDSVEQQLARYPLYGQVKGDSVFAAIAATKHIFCVTGRLEQMALLLDQTEPILAYNGTVVPVVPTKSQTVNLTPFQL